MTHASVLWSIDDVARAVFKDERGGTISSIQRIFEGISVAAHRCTGA